MSNATRSLLRASPMALAAVVVGCSRDSEASDGGRVVRERIADTTVVHSTRPRRWPEPGAGT